MFRNSNEALKSTFQAKEFSRDATGCICSVNFQARRFLIPPTSSTVSRINPTRHAYRGEVTASRDLSGGSGVSRFRSSSRRGETPRRPYVGAILGNISSSRRGDNSRTQDSSVFFFIPLRATSDSAFLAIAAAAARRRKQKGGVGRS